MCTDIAYMGAFLLVPIFLTEARGLSVTEAATLLSLRPASGSVFSIILAKLMGGLVSSLNLTTIGCFASVVAYGFARFVWASTADPTLATIAFVVLQAGSGFFVFLPANGLILERVHERDLSNMQAIVGMATTTAGNLGMAIGVALIRVSGDPHEPQSFFMTFNTFLGGAVAMLPLVMMLRLATRRAEAKDKGAAYTPLGQTDAG